MPFRRSRSGAPGAVSLGLFLLSGCATAGSPAIDLTALPYDAALEVDAQRMESTDSGVLFEDRDRGQGEEARRGSHVVVHYMGYFPDGTLFDTSLAADAEPLSFRLGAREVIRGWDEGIVGMREGGTRVLVVPPELAYGRQGYAGIIPGDQVLVYEIQLLEVR